MNRVLLGHFDSGPGEWPYPGDLAAAACKYFPGVPLEKLIVVFEINSDGGYAFLEAK